MQRFKHLVLSPNKNETYCKKTDKSQMARMLMVFCVNGVPEAAVEQNFLRVFAAGLRLLLVEGGIFAPGQQYETAESQCSRKDIMVKAATPAAPDLSRLFYADAPRRRVPSQQPRFVVGDTVCERFPFASTRRETGIVIERYELDNAYRYVVKFEDSREEVFFERELFPIPPSE